MRRSVPELRSIVPADGGVSARSLGSAVGGLLLASTLLASACADAGSTSASKSASSPAAPVGILEGLRGAGLTLRDAGSVEQPFFTRKAHVFTTGGGDLQLYEFSDASAAAQARKQVSKEGAIGGSMPMWIAPPHFYQRDATVIIYLGRDAAELASIEKVMGPQFAGR